jgi:hypothetical protein
MSVENKVINAEVEMAVQQIRVEHVVQLINETNPQGMRNKIGILQIELRSIIEALAFDADLRKFFDNLVDVRAEGQPLG